MILLVLSLTALSAFQGCANPFAPPPEAPTPPPGPVKIGILLPLTGTDAQIGENVRNSMELAVDLENGQISGHPVKLIFEDEGDQDESIALVKAKKLVQSDKVDLILGPLHDD
jgi:branched-chain amino acid transport system substrate-binding protein